MVARSSSKLRLPDAPPQPRDDNVMPTLPIANWPSLPQRPDQQLERGMNSLPLPARPDTDIEGGVLGSPVRSGPSGASTPSFRVNSVIPRLNLSVHADDEPIWDGWDFDVEYPAGHPTLGNGVEVPSDPVQGPPSSGAKMGAARLKGRACKGFCFVIVLGGIAGLIILFCSIHVLGPEEQVVISGPDLKSVRNGPATVLLSPFREKVFREVSHLEQMQYAVLKNMWTGKLHHYPGPGLLWLGAYDVVHGTLRKIVLQQQEYIRLFNNWTGFERVVAGPVILVPEPHEEAPGGVEKSIVIGPDATAILKNTTTGFLRLVSIPGIVTPGAYEVIFEVRMATVLGPMNYASVRSFLTGEQRQEAGPQLLKIGPYDQIVNISKKLVLHDDEYLKFKDRQTGDKRVLRGPGTFVPRPYEFVVNGIQRAALLDTDTAAIVLDRATGQQRLVAEKTAFSPGPYQEIIDTRPLIHLLPYEAVVVKDAQGRLTVHQGTDKNVAFFLPPFSQIVEMSWSSFNNRRDIIQSSTEETFENRRDLTTEETGSLRALAHNKIDLRVRRTFFTYEAFTSDNVRLLIDGTIFWRISSVPQMVRTTWDPEGDVWHHSRSALMQAVSRSTLVNFMSSFNDLAKQAFKDQEADAFYAERGVELHSMDITGYDCADNGTALILQEIIQETTNRINRLQVQETENEVQALTLAGNILLEKQRTQLVRNRGENLRLEAAATGDAEGLQRKGVAGTFIAGLNASVPDVEQRLELYKLHLLLKSINADTKQLASSNARLFLKLSDIDIKLGSS